MRPTQLILAAGLLFVPLHSALAQSRERPVLLQWTIVEAPQGEGSFSLAEREQTPLGRIAPGNSFLVTSAVKEASGSELVPANSLFSRSALAPDVACEPVRRRRQTSLVCLRDTNGDGSFDGFSRIRTHRVGGALEYLLGLYTVGGHRPLQTAIDATVIQENPPFQPVPLNLRFVGWSTGRSSGLAACVTRDFGPGIGGARVNDDICFPAQDVWRIQFPFDFAVAGAAVRITSRNDGRVSFSVRYPTVGSSF